MMLDSHIERRLATPLSLGVPRFHKRINYYTFKIRYLQLMNKRLGILPGSEIRIKLTNKYFNEYEAFN